MGSRGQASCRKCRQVVSGNTYLQFGYGVFKGGSKLCLNCASRLMEQSGVHTFRQWVERYIDTERPTTEVQRLRGRLEELERMIEDLTNPQS